MDHSKPRKSDAAATRKRRSSILKSQRNVRAPLSELEFNVATPPDQAKSRRVSFSRRTGVAEFEINDATTAWKNVYEEHNKSLESSANESGMKAAPRRVAHLGGRAAHFTDDEADAIDASEPAPPRAELSQLAHTHNTIQLFRLDTHDNPGARELTDNLDVDFSAVTPLHGDLDVLRKDLERESLPVNMSEYSIEVDFNATHITFKADDDDMSITDTIRSPTVTSTETRSQVDCVDWTADKENIVVNPYIAPKASDNFAVSDDGEDILVFDGKKCKFQSNLDLSDDELKPSRTTVCDDAASDMSVTQAVARVVLPARDEVIRPVRVEKTVFLDNDMTVTGVVPAQIFQGEVSDDKPSRTVVYDDAGADMSVTQAVGRFSLPERDDDKPRPSVDHKTVLLDDDMAMTGAVPAQIFQSENIDYTKPSRTVVYDDTAGDMSVTQAVERVLLPQYAVGRCGIDQKTGLNDSRAMPLALPAELLSNEVRNEGTSEPNTTRRKTVVFDNDDGNISVTQAVPTYIINAEKTVLDDVMAMTRPLPAEILSVEEPEPNGTRRKTVVFDNDDGNISVTQAVPTYIINAEKTVLDDVMAMTRPLPAEILPTKEPEPNGTRRKTVVFDNDDGNISVTQAVPTYIINTEKTVLDDVMAMTRPLPAEILSIEDELEPNATRRKTLVFGNDDGNISVTQAVPTNIINAEKTVLNDASALPEEILSSEDRHEGVSEPNATRRQTVVFGNDDGNISVTQVIPTNIINAEKTVPDDALAMSQTLPTDIHSKEDTHEEVPGPNATRRKTLVLGNDEGNISVTQAVPTNIINAEKSVLDDAIAMTRALTADSLLSLDRHEGMAELNASRLKTVIFGSDDSDISVTQSVPNNINPQMQPEPNKEINISTESILDALLDMSQASVEALAIEYVPKAEPYVTASNMTVTDAAQSSNTTLTAGAPRSSESYIVVCDDAVDEVDENVSKLANQSMKEIPERPAIEGSSPLPIEYKKEKHGIVCKLQHKLKELKSIIHVKEKTSPKRSPKSITYSSTNEDKNLSVNNSKAPLGSSVDLENRSQINDTDLKSASPEKNKTLTINLSSRTSSCHQHDMECSPLKNASLTSSHGEDCQEPAQKDQSQWMGQADDTRAILDALSDFTDTRRSPDFEQKPANKSRRSSAPNRKSLVISREDMLRDISMAQAIMKTEMQQTEEITEVSSDEQEATPPRLSSEVVKTLRFDDDESIIEPEPRVLQKPAVARSPPTRCPPRRASAVIPTYDVSEHVKELVHDLIKPMADVAPQCLPQFSREPSRGLQVDNLESSQIDLISSTPVLLEPRRISRSRTPEPSDIDLSPSRPVVIESRRTSRVHSPEPEPSDIDLSPSRPVVIESRRTSRVHSPEPEPSDIDLSPCKPAEIDPRRRSCLRTPDAEAHEKRVAITGEVLRKPAELVIVFDHLNPLNNVLLPPVDQTVVHKYNPRHSNESLSPSLDSQAVQTVTSESNSRGVDCGMVLITSMVDKSVASERSLRDTEANTSIVMKGNRELLAASSSLTLVDDALARSGFDVSVGEARARSRSRSPVHVIFKLDEPYSSVKLDSELTSDSSDRPHKRGHIAGKGTEVTPKPAIKVQKVSTRTRIRRLRSLSPTPDVSPSVSASASTCTSRDSSGTVSTVAAVWSCARSAASVGAERTDWRPDLMHEPSSKNLACEQDPGVNVVAKIDVLPFMGTSECEWESRAADTWSFRLLRSRLRLLVRLEHRACNTTRATVRADTPVRLVHVQHARRESDDDPVAALCLCLAATALQMVAARGVPRAGAVPGLLRRCAAVARVALRWGRAVRAARTLLAFSLKEDGLLQLKVANIPLRSVWEVTMRVELADSGRGVPWPRAVGVTVARVVAAWTPAPDELRRVLDTVPEDWGHVPRTVWKIFKYLKNKTPEDDLLTA